MAFALAKILVLFATFIAYPKRLEYVDRLVDIDSYDELRADKIGRIIIMLSERLEITGVRKSTLSEISKGYISFIDWCDNSGHHNVLQDAKKCQRRSSILY